MVITALTTHTGTAHFQVLYIAFNGLIGEAHFFKLNPGETQWAPMTHFHFSFVHQSLIDDGSGMDLGGNWENGLYTRGWCAFRVSHDWCRRGDVDVGVMVWCFVFLLVYADGVGAWKESACLFLQECLILLYISFIPATNSLGKPGKIWGQLGKLISHKNYIFFLTNSHIFFFLYSLYSRFWTMTKQIN